MKIQFNNHRFYWLQIIGDALLSLTKKLMISLLPKILLCFFFIINSQQLVAGTYTQKIVPSTFDTSGSWTGINQWTRNQDDGYKTVNLNFNFKMEDQTFTKIDINTNGTINLNGLGDSYIQYSNMSFANVSSSYQYFIAPFWDDLYPRVYDTVRYKISGNSPNKFITIWYKNIQRYDSSNQTYNFQVVLYENGDIRFRYENLSSVLNSATVGVYVKPGDYSQYTFNSTPYVSVDNDILYTLILAPILDMRFDQENPTGAGSILDETDNNHHGSPTNIQINRGVADVCYAPTFSDNSHIDIANSTLLEVGKNNADYTVSYWIKANVIQPSGYRSIIHKGATDTQRTFSAWIKSNNLHVHAAISTTSYFNYYNDSPLFNAETWTHLVQLKQGNKHSLFINGIEVKSQTLPSNSVSNSGPLVIGTSFSYNSFNGQFDELVIFDNALNQTQISAIYTSNLAGNNWDNSPKPECIAPVDHYRIKYNTQALTCEATNVEIQACADDSCSNLYSEEATATLLPASGWTGGNDISFTQSTVVPLRVTSNSEINVQLGLTALLPVPTSNDDVRCYNSNGRDYSCQLNFAKTGFIFDAINTQISGKFSDVGFSAQQLTVRAVKASDNSAAACLNVFTENTTVNVELKLNCLSPNSCLSDIVVKNNSVDSNVSSAYSTVPLTFSANSTANIAIKYPDAGGISLAIKHELITGDSASAINGFSNPFIVKPFGLRVKIDDVNASAVNSSSSVFRKAQQDFDVTVTAVGWKVDQDVNVDGQADIGKDLSSNDVVKNFINDNVRLARRKLQPTGSNTADGTLLSTEPTFINSGSIGSVATVTASWDEVGIIALDASLLDGQYMGVGNVTGHLENVGRFIPDHFEVSVIEQGIFDSQCSVFSYVGAKDSDGNGLITYILNPQLKLAAKSGVVGSSEIKTTVNYQGDFNKLDETLITVNGPTFDNVDNSLSIVSQLSNGTIFEFINDGERHYGVSVYKLSDNDNFYYVKGLASKIAPFDSSIQLTVASITDQDGVVSGANSLPVINPTTHEVRFGRVALLNAYGPEYSKLSMVFETQYWDGGKFVLNKEDNNCADSSTWQETLVANSTPNILTTLDVISPTKNGLGLLTLNAPTSIQKMGSLEVTLDVPSWLKYNWSGSAFNQNPLATATFGRFRGNDRIINWREQR